MKWKQGLPTFTPEPLWGLISLRLGFRRNFLWRTDRKFLRKPNWSQRDYFGATVGSIHYWKYYPITEPPPSSKETLDPPLTVHIYFYIIPLWSSTIIILQLMGHCACYIAYIRMQLLLFILQSVHLLYKYAIRINICFIRTRRINFSYYTNKLFSLRINFPGTL